jgi:inorganic pyrophosphatase
MKEEFWEYLQRMVDTNQVVIDRPKGTIHPKHGQTKYPVSYGYLAGTAAMDTSGVDIWVGSSSEKRVVGIQCSVDLLKRDTELKVLYACTDEEVEKIRQFVNQGQMRAICVKMEIIQR